MSNKRGVTRKLDDLGRVVIPMEFRKTLNVTSSTNLEVHCLENGFFVEVRKERCSCCGESSGLIENDGLWLCNQCVQNFREKMMQCK